MRRFLFATLALATSVASAQSFTPVRELKNLSAPAIAKLQLLETFNALPGGDWRFHAGDIPHGESPTLDDSGWQIVPQPKPRTAVKATKDAVWYRRNVTIPYSYNGYDLTGSRIWFQFNVDANGPMPEIIYFNGRRVALGDDLEPIVLFDHAKPGDSVLITVKLLHTVDEKSYRGVIMRIDPDPASTRPNPNDIRTQAIVAADLLPVLPKPRPDLLPKVEEAVAAIDTDALVAANKSLFESLRTGAPGPDSRTRVSTDQSGQPTPSQRKLLTEANNKFDASLIKAQSILSQLHDPLSTAKIDLAGNSHIDAAWLWPRSETIDVVHRTFTSAIQLMDEYPDYTFTQSAAQYSAWIADKYPELNKQIAERVKEGRWEIVGGMWVEPDLNLPGGESLVRQLLVGQRVFHDLYGVTARIGWNPDSFGYNWQLPQIYKRSGMDYFVTQKMHWNDTNQLPFRLFWWESPDGSKVLTYFPTDYAWTNLNPTRLAADFAESAARNPGTFEHLDLFGVGDHGGGPTRDMLDQGTHWIEASQHGLTENASAGGASVKPEGEGGFSPLSGGKKKEGALAPEGMPAAIPTMRFHTAQQYFDDVQTHLNPTSPTWNYDALAKGWTAPPTGPNGEVGIPTWNDELYFEYHRGVYTSQAKHKANMRRSEAETLDAEKLASFAWLYGASYPAADLTENWKKITFNQFHDLAAGSGIATIYRDAQKDFTEVFHSDDLILQSAFDSIKSHIDTHSWSGSSIPVIVNNNLPWTRSETVELTLQLPDEHLRKYIHNDASWGLLTPGEGDILLTQVVSSNDASNTVTMLAQVNNIPSIGYDVLGSLPAIHGSVRDEPSDIKVDTTDDIFLLQTGSVKFAIDRKSGCITSIESSEGSQYLAPNSCGNQLQAFADNPKNYDAWNIDPGTLDKAPTILDKADSVKLVVDGPLRKTIRVERTFNKSHITQNISLDAGADTVFIDTTVDWHEKHVLLKAAFPLAASSGKATYEIPFGSIQRPTTRDNTFSKAQFEVPALRWADLGDDKQGVSILNDSKYGYDALGNTLRITLLRSPTWPDPDADQGTQHFRYAIYPHTGPWQKSETIHRAYELNQPLTATQTFAHTGSLPPTYSFASVDQPNVILTAVKKAEDADALIFRVYEATGQATSVTLHVPPGATTATETNLMETPQGSALPMANNTVIVSIKPYEILTVEVAYPKK